MSVPRTSARLKVGTVGIVALVLVATWAAVTSAYGVFDLLNSADQALSWRRPSGGIPLPFGLGLLVTVGWVLSLNLLLPAIVMGIVEIATADASVRARIVRSVAYAALVAGSAAALMVFSQLRNNSADLALSVWSLDVFGAVVFPIVAWAVFLAAWMLLRVNARASVPASLSPYPSVGARENGHRED